MQNYLEQPCSVFVFFPTCGMATLHHSNYQCWIVNYNDNYN